MSLETSTQEPGKAAARVEELRSVIRKCDAAYYTSGNPLMTDQDYDKLFKELASLEAAHPVLVDDDSPTRRLTGVVLEGFHRANHLSPMLSIEDVFESKDPEKTLDELWEFISRAVESANDGLPGDHNPVEWVLEPKIDGLAVNLIYRGGRLERAVTRGDGKTGDDVTDNIRTIRCIPLVAEGRDGDEVLEVRGEVFMPRDTFLALNRAREEAGEQVMANPRNAAAGTLKLLDTAEVARRGLGFLAHGIGEYGINDPFTELFPSAMPHDRAYRNLLAEMGIPAVPAVSCWSPSAMKEALDKFRDTRGDHPYATDGVVFKLAEMELRHKLGATARHPRWACAFKFLPEQAETVLYQITGQVGRTGVVTPVAELVPVPLSGTTVSRATLHNQEEIARKDIRLGDTVLVEKSGEIIPAVIKWTRRLVSQRPVPAMRESIEGDGLEPLAEPFDLIAHLGGKCPSCGDGGLVKLEGEVAIRCTNMSCPAQLSRAIKHFASRKALDIPNLGEAVADSIAATGTVKSVLDLMTMPEFFFHNLAWKTARGVSKVGSTRARKIQEGLLAARTKPLDRWLFALGIRTVGEGTSREISRLFKSWSAMAADHRLLEAVVNQEDTGPHMISPQLGPVSAGHLLAFIGGPRGEAVAQLFATLCMDPVSDNYDPVPTASADKPLSGKTVVVTGTLGKPRPAIEEAIRRAGGKVGSSVTGKTSFLVAGEACGSKLTKANELGIPVKTEEELYQIIQPQP